MKIYIPSFILTNFHENLRSSFFHGLNGTIPCVHHYINFLKFSPMIKWDFKVSSGGIKWLYEWTKVSGGCIKRSL